MQRSGIRGLIVPAIVALIGFAILMSLGVWQVERLQWKEALIARVASRLDAPPVPAPGPSAWSDPDLAEMEYQPVTLTGRYSHAHEADVVHTLTEPKGPARGIGYMVMTPLVTDDGWMVYVNRGFLPEELKSDRRRIEAFEGEVTVTGLFRMGRAPSWFVPGNDVSGNAWFSRNPKDYAEAYGLPPAGVAPYIIDAFYDADLPAGSPQGGETIVSFPNNHLQYAITWFGLAAALAGVFIAWVRGRLKR